MGCGGRRKKFFKTFTAEIAENAEKPAKANIKKQNCLATEDTEVTEL
jgi:hypothetical protein